MSGVSDEKLDKLLSEWFKLKAQINMFQKREADIKELINDIMREENKRMLQTENYLVSKRNQKRTGVSQKDIPEDVWNRYSKTTEFSVFQLKRLN